MANNEHSRESPADSDAAPSAAKPGDETTKPEGEAAKPEDDGSKSEVVRILEKRVGLTGIVLFEIYFLVLGALSAYVLWALWPPPGNADCVPVATCVVNVLGLSIDLEGRGSEGRLLLIAATSGILGSFLHASTSFVVYVGNRRLVRSWMAWYVLRPVIGMVLGIVFYVVIRAGLISADSAPDPYGIAAIAALSGMFSKQAIDKLKEIFDQLFSTKADESRTDKPTEEQERKAEGERQSTAGGGQGEG